MLIRLSEAKLERNKLNMWGLKIYLEPQHELIQLLWYMEKYQTQYVMHADKQNTLPSQMEYYVYYVQICQPKDFHINTKKYYQTWLRPQARFAINLTLIIYC